MMKLTLLNSLLLVIIMCQVYFVHRRIDEIDVRYMALYESWLRMPREEPNNTETIKQVLTFLGANLTTLLAARGIL